MTFLFLLLVPLTSPRQLALVRGYSTAKKVKPANRIPSDPSDRLLTNSVLLEVSSRLSLEGIAKRNITAKWPGCGTAGTCGKNGANGFDGSTENRTDFKCLEAKKMDCTIRCEDEKKSHLQREKNCHLAVNFAPSLCRLW
jgi:hypothetical protein